MKIVVASTCRRTETLTISHLSQGLVERVESILVERCWTPIFVGRASRVKGENLLLGWGFDFGRMGFQWMAFWWPWPFWEQGVWQRPIALRPLDGGRPIAWSTCDLCLVLTKPLYAKCVLVPKKGRDMSIFGPKCRATEQLVGTWAVAKTLHNITNPRLPLTNKRYYPVWATFHTVTPRASPFVWAFDSSGCI